MTHREASNVFYWLPLYISIQSRQIVLIVMYQCLSNKIWLSLTSGPSAYVFLMSRFILDILQFVKCFKVFERGISISIKCMNAFPIHGTRLILPLLVYWILACSLIYLGLISSEFRLRRLNFEQHHSDFNILFTSVFWLL